MADYAQRNTIAFKSSESVLSSEKIVATYAIDNVNIAESKELFVLPFSEGQDSAGALYIGSAFDGYTLGTWNAEKSNLYLSRVSLPLNESLQSVLEQGTSIVAEVKMTEQKFDTLKNDMVLFFENAAWVWTDGVWSNGVARLSLSKVSVESVKPLPPRIPLEYQEVEYIKGRGTDLSDSPSIDFNSYPFFNDKVILEFDARIGIKRNYLVLGILWVGRWSYDGRGKLENGDCGYFATNYEMGAGFFVTNQINDYSNYRKTKVIINLDATKATSYQPIGISIPLEFSAYADGVQLPLAKYSGTCDDDVFYVKEYISTAYTFVSQFPISKISHGGEFYYASAKKENGEYIRIWIPAYNKSSLALGLYDTISGDFIEMPTCIAGPDVAPPDRPWE